MNENSVSREEFLEVTGTIKIDIAEIKKDILHLSEKIDSIANVRSWVIAISAIIAALTGIGTFIRSFFP